MALLSVDAIVAAYGSVQTFNSMNPSVTTVGGQMQSDWIAAGNPGAAVAPTTGAVPTSAISGCRYPFSNPGSGNSYISRLTHASTIAGCLFVADRLYHNGGFSGTVTAAQTCGAAALTRYTSGVGVEIWLEAYTALGATSTTYTVSYTNQAGSTGRTGTYVGTLHAGVGCMGQVQLQAGDTGVKSVQTVTLTATTGTAGNFGVTLLYRLATLPVVSLCGAMMDPFMLGMPQVVNSACLFKMWLPQTTTSGMWMTSLDIIQG